MTHFLVMLLVAAGVAAAKGPHIFFMMADQLRFDALGVYGNTRGATPNLDKFGADGIAFHAFSSTPTCTPARAGLLTGRSPWGHGMLGYGVVAPEYPYEMGTTMAAAGYDTRSIGKDHFGWNGTTNTGIPHGFANTQIYDGLGTGEPAQNDTNGYDDYDQWFQSQLPGKDPLGTGLDWNTWHGKAYIYPEQYHPTAWVGQRAVDMINAYPFDDESAPPLFLKVSWHRPHSPYDPPARLLNASMAKGDFPPMHINDPKAVGAWDMRFWGTAGAPPGCGPTTDAWCGVMPSNETYVSRHAYYASIAFVDEWFGNVIGAMKSRGVYDDAVIIWAADHGDGQGDHAHWRKGYPYEFSSHVPMMLKWPKSEAGVTVPPGTVLSPGPVTELRDVFPTVADYGSAAGPPPGVTPEGASLRCLLRDPTGKQCNWREYIDLEHNVVYNYSVHWSALADSGMKYVYRAYFGTEQLFNTTADPWEMADLSTDPAHADTLQLWRSRMVAQFQREGRGPAWVSNGQLVPRPQSINYGPNFPLPPPPAPHSRLMLETCVDNAVAPLNNSMLWTLETASTADAGNTTVLRLIAPSAEFGALCFNATASIGALDVDVCDHSSAAQWFAMASNERGPITHVASGLCLDVHQSDKTPGTHVQLDKCSDSQHGQQWTLGLSGRLFSELSDGLCVTANVPKWAGLFKDYVSDSSVAAPVVNSLGFASP